jgi:hypothetical protein
MFGNASTANIMLPFSGDIEIVCIFLMPSVWQMMLRVWEVAVAVKAMTFTFAGIALLTSDSRVKAFLKSAPLYRADHVCINLIDYIAQYFMHMVLHHITYKLRS